MTTPTRTSASPAPSRSSDEVFRDAERDDAYFRAQLNKDYTPSGRTAPEIGQALHDKYAPDTSSALGLLGFSPQQQAAISQWQGGQETELLDMVLTPEQKASYLQFRAENAEKRRLAEPDDDYGRLLGEDSGRLHVDKDDKADDKSQDKAEDKDKSQEAESGAKTHKLGDGREIQYDVDDKGNKIIEGVTDPRLNGKILDIDDKGQAKVVDPESGKVVEDLSASEGRQGSGFATEDLKPEDTKPEVEDKDATESANPELKDPEATQPDKSESVKPEAEPKQPEKSEPEVTEPEVTEPTKPEPEKSEPGATEPTKPEPEKSEPEATEPAKPEPQDPEATQPDKSEPEIKPEPDVTEPEVRDPEAADTPDANPPIIDDPNQPPIEPKDPNDALLPQPDGLEGIPAHEDPALEHDGPDVGETKPADQSDPGHHDDSALVVDPGFEEVELPESEPGTEAPAPALASVAADNSEAEAKSKDDESMTTDKSAEDKSEEKSEPEAEKESEAEAEADGPEVG